MLRTALTPRWLWRHLLVLAAVAVLVLLGRWQWGRAESVTGTLQNLLYAFQWWIFGGVVVYGWWRTLRDEARPETAPKPRHILTGNGVTARPAVPGQAEPVAAEEALQAQEDDELAAYNRYLAWLHENPRR